MRSIPPTLPSGPFNRAIALAHGVTPRMLEGKRFLRLFPGVWCLREHDMSEADWFVAAGMALPDRAHLTGTSRLQQLGLDHGPRRCTMVTSLSRRWRRSP